MTTGRERRVRCVRPPRPARLQSPRRRQRRGGSGPPGRLGWGDRRRHGLRRSRACAPAATPGLRSAPVSASAARPHSNAGARIGC